ncbi:putative N-acetylated-alpha-linked acidic dipeptidase 2 isoform X2 [Apostichopus japonicus]|uniref:Putative N-acetylated-alpha-linked acidic dipeptidase 2 isoform X2 n=2 Tax=Stichopus japonicus TaxID=307972 RepID=A0A2G8KVY5_STIJA|nr:putative N-acetylated-alpha-linked acidic dipeptidase 2 isoform X2 [Apostichopus japonicus]
MYETFHFVSAVLDPTFQYHLALARVWAELARSLSDAHIVPINCSAYAERIKSGVDQLKDLYEDKMAVRPEPITFAAIDEQLQKFTMAAADLHKRIENMDKSDPFAVRAVNDQLMLLERAFIEPQGMPGKPYHRHAVFSPANINKAYRDAFAVIADKMLEVERADDPELAWKEVERYMAIAAFVLDSAATTLMEVDILAKDVSSDESRYNS